MRLRLPVQLRLCNQLSKNDIRITPTTSAFRFLLLNRPFSATRASLNDHSFSSPSAESFHHHQHQTTSSSSLSGYDQGTSSSLTREELNRLDTPQVTSPGEGGDDSDEGKRPTREDIRDILPHLSPTQLAEAIWGFAKRGQRPSDDFMSIVASEVHGKLHKFRSQDLSNTIWALAVLKYQPSAPWWEEFERQVYKNLTEFNGRELSNLLWAFAILEHSPGWIMDSLLSHALDSLPCYSANSLHLLIWSLGKMGHMPNQEFIKEFQKASQACFFQFTPPEMANIIWAFARLGIKLPDMWLDNFLMVAQWRFPSFSAKLLSILVWGAAMLEHRPSQEWMLCFEQQVREKFNDFSGQELSCVAWALRRFGCSGESNAVFYMLHQQESFREVDFEILSNSKLLGQVMTWRNNGSGAMGSSEVGQLPCHRP